MIDWVKERLDHLVERLGMAKCSFEVCSINSSVRLKVRSASFYQQYVEKAPRNLETDVEERKDDPFLMIVED